MIQWKLIFTALSMILFISVVHIITPVEKILLHISFRFLYLIPIALAGFKGGKKHGLIIALLSILAYLPHFFIQDMPESFQIENVLGMTIFCIVEILSGTYADLKRNSVIRKYDAVPLHPHQKRKETILFYVDDSPKSLNCPNWSAANHLNNHRCNLNILYGPSYAMPGEAAPDYLKNKIVSLSALKKAITQIGFPKERIGIKFVESNKKEPLSW